MTDLIDRQAAIEAISYSEIAFYPGDNEGDCLRRDSDIKQAIMALPSAEPERKTGRWLRSGSDLFPFECDQCAETNERTTPWCPHCGCKMEVEHEHNTNKDAANA